MEYINNYYGFVVAVVLLALVPGADTIFMLTKSIGGGLKVGLASALGINLGIIAHTTIAACGLSVLIMASSTLFNIIKIAGALYLIYLGIMSIKAKTHLDLSGKYEKSSLYKVCRQGFFTNILNPKVALFFVAFLPQFVKNGTSSPLPFFILGFTMLLVGLIWSAIVVFFASTLSEKLRTSSFSKYINKISGVVFIILGLNILRVKP